MSGDVHLISPSPASEAGGTVDWIGRFEEEILRDGQIDSARLNRARSSAARAGEPLAAVLVKLGLCTESVVSTAVARAMDLPHRILLPTDNLPPECANIKLAFLRTSEAVPVELKGNRLLLVMANPADLECADAVAYKTGLKVDRAVGLRSEILALIERQAPIEVNSLPVSIGAATENADLERLIDLARGAPVVRWVEDLLALAIEASASDIHIESERTGLRVRIRVDGALQEIDRPLDGAPEAAVSRIKILAKLNIAERRLPQDGRIRVAVQGREIDLRIATLPSLHGETVVLRLLDQSAGHLTLDHLGLSAHALEMIRHAVARPHGMMLVTGPTGSGKTTTLYACLRHLISPELKFVSVEDPVEYEIAGVTQVQVKPEIGLGFGQALRSVLRHDLNVLMIGEIRDLDSASIAVEAALTGHSILSTIHTNSAPATVTRLIEMGIEDYLVASTVNAISAQRLLRRLCSECARPAALPTGFIERIMPHLCGDMPNGFLQSVGCVKCRGTGFRGRLSVAEVMPVSGSIQTAIMSRMPEQELRALAISEGMLPLICEGLRQAQAGQTSLDEVLAVLGTQYL
jgi:general secretion pathway protein E